MGIFSPAICAIQKVMSGYNIANAALFDGTTGYFSWTPGSAGNQKTWTFSCWVLSYADGPFEILNAKSGSAFTALTYSGSETFSYGHYNGTAYDFRKDPVGVYRDRTAWTHIVISLDATSTTATIEINGSSPTLSIDINPTNIDFLINSAIQHEIGSQSGTRFAKTYMADIRFIDGLVKPASGFGKFDLVTGNWISKKYAGTYGTNGFHLDFADSLNLGADVSGNGNNFTVNGTVIQVTSTPTDNVTMLNALIPLGKTISNGNRTYNGGNASTWHNLRANLIADGGKFYAEVSPGGGLAGCGIAVTDDPNYYAVGDYPGATTSSVGVYASTSGTVYVGLAGATAVSTGLTVATGDRFLSAFDADTGKAWAGFYDASTTATYWYDSAGGTTGNPVTGANPTYTFMAGIALTFCASTYSTTNAVTLYCDANDWTLSVPTGFKALTTYNLPSRAPKTPTTPQTGSFTGNGNADGPFLNLGMVPDKAIVSTINGNTITWGTHADATANGVKLRTSSASYNSIGSNTYSIAVKAYSGGLNVPPANAQGN